MARLRRRQHRRPSRPVPGRRDVRASTTNRRSRPEIIEAANALRDDDPRPAPQDDGRAPRRPRAHARRSSSGRGDHEADEAGRIAALILDLARRAACRYRDIAVLVRGRAAYPRLVEQFGALGVPVQPGGRTGLFDQPEADVLGRTIAWITDIDWRDAVRPPETASPSDGTARRVPAGVRALGRPSAGASRESSAPWRAAVPRRDRTANLVGEFYELLGELGVRDWDLADPLAGQPARHPRALLRRCSPTTSPSAGGRDPTRDVAGRAGRRPGPRPLVLPEPRHPHHQLRAGRLRGLRRRAGLRRSTPSTSRPSTEPRASSGPSSSCRR